MALRRDHPPDPHPEPRGSGVEVLADDLGGRPDDLATVFGARPEVFAHNLETVPRIFREIRPGFRFDRSLDVLRQAHRAGMITKSNLILGMGETTQEVIATLHALRETGCDILTLTQYLRPSPLYRPVDRWVRPQEFAELKAEADRMGFAGVLAGPCAHRGPGLLVGVLVMGLSQLVMVAVMTMTPVHLHDHGHGTAASGLVIGLHVGAMYLPSPLTGFLVDRYGSTAVATASALTLLTSGVLAACAPGDSVALSAVALVLLGLGWNFGLVSGTAIVTQAAPAATRARTQGLADVAIAIAGAAGGLLSGLVVATAGYSVLAVAGGALALAILPAVMVAALRIRQGQGGNGLQREVR